MYKIVSRNNTRAHTEYGILYGILHLLKYAINSNKRSNKKKLYHIYDWGDLIFICFSSRIWLFLLQDLLRNEKTARSGMATTWWST